MLGVETAESTSTLARWLITGGIGLGTLIAVLAGGLVLRALLKRWDRNLPGAVVGAGAVAIMIVVVAVFQPQKLFIDDVVDEADPLAGETPAATESPDALPADDASPAPVPSQSMLPDVTMSETMPADDGPRVLLVGSFMDRVHPTSGTAEVIELEDGSRILRLEDFATDNGPGLRVYLSSAPSDAGNGAFDDDFLDLGALKGNIGNQNYDIPADADLAIHRIVVIWCDPFNVTFGVAGLG